MPSLQPVATRSNLNSALAYVAIATFLIALMGLNARATYGAQVTADEPQYLLTALSLGEDGDLDIADEIAEQRFRAFHEIGLNPQTVELNDSGQRLSPHDPGLPAVLALPMRLGGWRLAKVALAFTAALAAGATTWVAVRRFKVSTITASLVTVAFFATPPLVGYATQIYPEMPAALLVIVGLACLTGTAPDGPSNKSQTAAVLVVIGLPWLAIKYAPVAMILALALLASLASKDGTGRRSPGRVTAPAAVLALAAAVYLVAHQRIYGGWTVYAAGDHFVDGEFLVVGNEPNYLGRSRRLIGLLVDRGFGLVAWAPAYIMMVPALAALLRRGVKGSLLIASLLATGWAVSTWIALTMHGWWWPGRQVVVVLPLAVVAVAVFVDGRKRLFATLMAAAALGVANWVWLVGEASTGRRTLIVDFTETASPLYRIWSAVLPNHQSPGPVDLALTAAWTIGLGVLAWLAWRDAGHERSSATL